MELQKVYELLVKLLTVAAGVAFGWLSLYWVSVSVVTIIAPFTGQSEQQYRDDLAMRPIGFVFLALYALVVYLLWRYGRGRPRARALFLVGSVLGVVGAIFTLALRMA